MTAASATSLYASIAPQFTRELQRPGPRVGYSDVGGVWQLLAPSLLQHLPLRAIEWRNLVGVTQRIDQLFLRFVEISVKNVKKELFLTCLYLVTCEDLDKYKSVVRPAVAAWIEAMTAAHIEWLVLYVPLGTQPKTAGTNAPNPVYKKIYDRLRADFAQKKNGVLAAASASSSSLLQERVCKIDTLEGTSVVGKRQQQHEAQWTEVLLRLRHCVMDAFQIKCFQYEESLRALDAKRGIAGWDFGAFFLAKERLALMYQQMCLQDDAIRHLDELDAIFVNLSATEKQAFRLTNRKSFERHDPIFTQSPLLERASSFIEFFLTELKELVVEDTLNWYQPFLWAAGACMEVSHACELSWSGRDSERMASDISVQAARAIPVEAMSRALGSVLYLARRLLKSVAKRIRNENDLGVPLSNIANTDAADESITWYQRLERVFLSPEWQRSGTCDIYEKCLSEVTHLASVHFSRSGRHRFAVFLAVKCAQYHFVRGEFESSSQLLCAHARQSREDGWWTIFDACVRSAYRAELGLGRSTRAAVASVILSTLVQEGQDNEDMAQLMVALLACGGDGKVEGKGVVSGGNGSNPGSVPNVTVSELFRPMLAVETCQTSGSALGEGNVCVTLAIANDFSVSVRFERVRVRFTRTTGSCKSSITNELSHFDSPRRNEDTNVDACVGNGTGKALDAKLVHETDCRSFDRTVQAESATACGGVVENVREQNIELLLEKCDVHIDEKTSVKLVFRYAGVPVGQYTCTGTECVLAGSTFCLLPSHALSLARFEICAKESIVQVAIHGALLLVPRPLPEAETVAVSIQASHDPVVDGVLEVRAFRRIGGRNVNSCITQGCDKVEEGKSSGVGERDIQLIGIQLVDETKLTDTMSHDGTQSNYIARHEESNRSLSIALPELLRGDSLRYTVSLALPHVLSADSSSDVAGEDDNANHVIIQARVRYQRHRMVSSTLTTATEVRCTESTFRALQPLKEIVRLKRVGMRIFVSVVLVCNHFVSIVLQEYQLRCPVQISNHSPLVTVEHDPNAKLRGTTLHPNDRLHLAFTLACCTNFEKEAFDSYCSLQLDIKFGGDETWLKTVTVRLPLTDVEGTCYQIDILPEDQDDAQMYIGDIIETSASEPVTFQVWVHEELTKSNEATMANGRSTLYLRLDESSERDWILLGKQLERFTFDPCSGSHDDDRRREFRTQKRLLATRSGLLRFPAFCLEVNGNAIPAARVYCQQSCRQVFASE
uniref:TRAPPC10/Trs130 N-terminal domain-containing protein n=1 Tax=Hyaloperonospora arabidopsidis (strain Emoy2) TaxID=559515 RepID=M4BZS7_HYAAE